MIRLLRRERGLTLTEVVVVMVIGTLIMAGIVGFYLSSQGVWLDSSTQVITQREASLIASAFRDSVRGSGSANVSAVPDPQHCQLALYKRKGDATPSYYIWWNTADSLVYSGTTVGGNGSGPMGVSRAERLQFVNVVDPNNPKVRNVRMDLRMLTASGESVEISAFAVFRN
jgi:prepilin-type N-terminal cleavage/methylation domain-containing protein